jgi:hypothetical protein
MAYHLAFQLNGRCETRTHDLSLTWPSQLKVTGTTLMAERIDPRILLW